MPLQKGKLEHQISFWDARGRYFPSYSWPSICSYSLCDVARTLLKCDILNFSQEIFKQSTRKRQARLLR